MPLLNRPQPLPFEDLENFQERLRRANYYEEPNWLEHLVPSHPIRDWKLLRSAQHFDRLSDLTMLSVETLYGMTLHRFAARFHLPHELAAVPGEFGDINAPLWSWQEYTTYINGEGTFKICPDCWAESPVMRLPWKLRHVTTCAVHQILLVDRCSGCGHHLRFDRVTRLCHYCGHDLATIPTISIADHRPSMELTALIGSAVGCIADPFPSPSLPIDASHPLHEMAPAVLLRFLWHFGKILVKLDPSNPLFDSALSLPGMEWSVPSSVLRRASVVQMHGLLTAMWRILSDWPNSVYPILERLAACDYAGLIYNRLPEVLVHQWTGPEWTWLHHTWGTFMQRAMWENTSLQFWTPYYRTLQDRTLRGLPRLLTAREVAREIHEDVDEVERLIQAGVLRVTSDAYGPKRRGFWRYIDAQSVPVVQAEQEHYLSLKDAAARYGMTTMIFASLVEVGIVRAESGRTVDGSPTWKFHDATVRACLEELLAALPVLDGITEVSPDVLTMQLAASVSGKNCGFLLRACKDGRLPAFRQSGIEGVVAIRFLRMDIETFRYRELRDQETELVSRCNLYNRWGCRAKTLERLAQAGLLIPCKQEQKGRRVYWWYDREDVTRFEQRYILTGQATGILNCTRLTIQSWTKSGRLPAVMGPTVDGSHYYRYDKTMLEEWRHERCTTGEAMGTLGISKATLHRWAEQGVLNPLTDMGGKQRWYARRDVEMLAQQRVQ